MLLNGLKKIPKKSWGTSKAIKKMSHAQCEEVQRDETKRAKISFQTIDHIGYNSSSLGLNLRRKK